MTQLKKILFVLAVAVSLGLVGASNALAQYACTANSVPTLIRSQGLTELTGTLVLNNCTGPAAPAGGPTVGLTVTNQPGSAVITNSTTTGYKPTLRVTTATAGVNNAPVQSAGVVSGNTVSFGFTIPAGDTLAVGGAPAVQIGVVPGVIGSVGIRVNASASGITFPSQIAALLTSSPAGVLAITNNFLNVAIPLPGLAATFTNGGGIAQCALTIVKGTPPATIATAAGPPATFTMPGASTNSGFATFSPSVPIITATEGFASSFLIGGTTGEGSDTTTATVTAGVITTAGTRATRLLIRISGLPSGLAVYAPETVTTTTAGGTLTFVLVPGADGNGNGGTGGGTDGTIAAPSAIVADLVSGTTITYSVTAATNSVTEKVAIPLGLFTTATPGLGTATANVALGAISTVGTGAAIATAPMPRFADVAFSGATAAVIGCVTNILFPYITNTVGYDVGLTIANTTTDIFGTTSQSGTCIYNFFGTNAPAGGTFTTPAFGGGATDARLLSSMAPGFTGYAIAQCNFQLGHGFFFIVYNLGTSTGVAQGSPALIIFQPLAPLATRQGLASFGPPFGEALGH